MELTAEERKQIGQATSTGRGNNIRYGRYVLMIDKWYFRKGYTGLSDIHELVVLKSEKMIVMEGEKKVEVEPNPEDSSASAVFSYGGKGKVMAPINTTGFVLALMGLKDEQITGDEKMSALEEFTNEDPKKFEGRVNPCRGMIIGCETVPTQTRESKQWITALKWVHLAPPGGTGENSFEKAAERWAAYQSRIRAKAA